MEVIKEINPIQIGQTLRSIAAEFGSATEIIIITATKNLYLNVHSNIFQRLLMHVILLYFQKIQEKVWQLF